jgi:RNA polymerase sigma-70 factor, ECF subfamily
MTGEDYAELRPLLFSIAYRMTGSVADSEDIVQEALLRRHRIGDEREIESDRAYLSTTTARLAIDHLRSARVRREAYVGPWMPEPIVEGREPDPAEHAETADSLSLAFLVVLETLTPVERAVFLLREVFDYDYDEIARIVGKSEANCRQVAVRARAHVNDRTPRFEASREHREELADRFFAAAEQGEVAALERMLAADAVLYSDSGGKVRGAALNPVHGRDRVTRLLEYFFRALRDHDMRLERAEVNGQPGALVRDPHGRLFNVFALDIAGDGSIQTVRSLSNPDKLAHLGRLAPREPAGDGPRHGRS